MIIFNLSWITDPGNQTKWRDVERNNVWHSWERIQFRTQMMPWTGQDTIMVGLLSGLSTPWCNVLNLFRVIIYMEFWVFVLQISIDVEVTMIVLGKYEYLNYKHISTGCGQYKLLFLQVLSSDYSCIPVVTMSLLLSRLSHLRHIMQLYSDERDWC